MLKTQDNCSAVVGIRKCGFLLILLIAANVCGAQKTPNLTAKTGSLNTATMAPKVAQMNQRPIKACIYNEKVIYKYNRKQATPVQTGDSVVMVRDTAWLFVNSPVPSQSFRLVVNDTCRVEDSMFIAGDTIGLNAVMRSVLGLNANGLETDSVLPLASIRIVPDGQVSTYYKETIVEVKEEKSAPSAEKGHRPHWAVVVATIVALLLSLASLACILAMKKKEKGMGKDNENGTSNIDAPAGADESGTKQERKGLIKQIDDCKAENKGLKKHNDELQSEIEKWKTKTCFDSPEKAETGIRQLLSDVKQLQTLKAEKDALTSIVKKLKETPEAFEDDKEYGKLSLLIKKAHRCDQLNDNPSQIDPKSATGELVRKGQFLDEAKNDPQKIIEDTAFLKDTNIQKLLRCILKPFDICNTEYHKTGLYKLVADIQKISEKVVNHEVVSEADLTSNEEVKTQLKPLIDPANSYLQFDGYKNYWNNVRKPLLDALDDMVNPQHDDNYKMRSLMFYASQFLSMTYVMGGIYDNSSVSDAFKDNVKVFNDSSALPNGAYGFPDVPDASLEKYKFDYELHARLEKNKEYYRRFAPMKFIYINVYYNYPEENA